MQKEMLKDVDEDAFAPSDEGGETSTEEVTLEEDCDVETTNETISSQLHNSEGYVVESDVEEEA